MMFKSLRSRLILSHVLPLLIIVPLVGIALIYVLETQVMLTNLSNELLGQAMLIAEMSTNRTGIWQSSDQAQAFVTYLETYVDTSVMLLDTSGNLLASSDPDDAENVGSSVEIVDLTSILGGNPAINTTFSRQIHRETVEVLVPVSSSNQHVVGIIRLNHQLASITERFYRLRYLISGVLVIGLLLGALIGWVLALNLERPLRQATRAVSQLASGQQMKPLPEQGPVELQLLARSVNTLVERLRSLEQARRQ
ncbi:MAG: HAMP domain-containing protein, partial [Anaerolineales bacterium]|nr:HAMP domain-containing protein [Anaerolineales bacterium]